MILYFLNLGQFECWVKKEFALNSSPLWLRSTGKINSKADRSSRIDKWSYFLTNSQFHIMVPHNCVLDKKFLKENLPFSLKT